MYEYRAVVLKVIDGDTLRLAVDLGLDLRHHITVRLADINAPELSTPQGQSAREFCSAWLDAHSWEVLIRTHKDRREKYGRYLATIWQLADVPDRSLNDDLIAAGHAVPYDGGKR